jgi:serpin B
MALGMTLNGAAGQTDADMRRTLGFGDMKRDEINASYKSILDALPNLDPKTLLEIANSIWVRKDFPVQPDFISVNRQFYYAEVRGLDFASPDAPGVINGWIGEKTHGRITNVIDRIDPAAVMFLINAVYFKGTWLYEFNPELTADDAFIKSDGTPTPCKMMKQKATLAYFETDQFQALDLPYGNGRFSMSIFLPKSGQSLDAFVTSFTPENWSVWRERFEPRETILQLPKFKLDYGIKLNDALTALGMGVAFVPGEADFGGINPDAELFIHQVKHKTFVEVDEKGTEAAAVTVVEIGVTSVGPGNETVMRVDRPFLFVIREKSSDALLFIGKIINL